jgi:hypothetical protein
VRNIMAITVLALAATGCNDGTFRIDPLLATDTIGVFAPTAANAGLAPPRWT